MFRMLKLIRVWCHFLYTLSASFLVTLQLISNPTCITLSNFSLSCFPTFCEQDYVFCLQTISNISLQPWLTVDIPGPCKHVHCMKCYSIPSPCMWSERDTWGAEECEWYLGLKDCGFIQEVGTQDKQSLFSDITGHKNTYTFKRFRHTSHA